MNKEQLIEALEVNGFEVVVSGFVNIRYGDKFVVAMNEDSVLKNHSVVKLLPKMKQSQLDYLIKKYQGLLKYDSVVEF